MHNNLKKNIFYIRIILFIISLIIDFLLIKFIYKFGITGYIFLSIEIIYIMFTIYSLLIKCKACANNVTFNIMQMGMYIYKTIIYIQVISFKLLLFDKDIIGLYRGNFVLLCILLVLIVIYEILLINPQKNKV